MSKNRKNPWPDPEKEWYDQNKGKKVRLAADLLGQSFIEGVLVWVSAYSVGVRIGQKVIMISKSYIAGKEPLE